MTTTLIRAYFCEYIATLLNMTNKKDSFFMAGLFSNLGAYFKLPLEVVLDQLPLSSELKDALLNETCLMGKTIALIKKYEQGGLITETDKIGDLTTKTLNETYLKACAWAQKINGY